VGEAGAIPVPALVAAAIDDALAPLGVRVREMPLDPDRLLALLRSVRRGSARRRAGMSAQAFRVGMRAPDDVSEGARLRDQGAFRAEHVVAILGKTEGNGGVNDYTRALATLSFQLLIAERTGQKVAAIAKRVPIIWSGGTEG